MPKSNEELEREIAVLKAKLDTLTQTNPSPTKPFAKFDPTANMRMPQSAIDAMSSAVGDNLMRDIVNDHRRGVSPPYSMIASDHSYQAKPQIGERGWVDAQPLSTQPGIGIIDQMCQAQDARDRAKR
jgi:hypothetical protein